MLINLTHWSGFIRYQMLWLWFVSSQASAPDYQLAARPNLVIALADDLGFSDVGWANKNLLTPTLDALARTGVVLHRHYGTSAFSDTDSALESFISSGKYLF